MRFPDREMAGRQFAAKLTHLKDAQPVALALPWRRRCRLRNLSRLSARRSTLCSSAKLGCPRRAPARRSGSGQRKYRSGGNLMTSSLAMAGRPVIPLYRLRQCGCGRRRSTAPGRACPSQWPLYPREAVDRAIFETPSERIAAGEICRRGSTTTPMRAVTPRTAVSNHSTITWKPANIA